MLQCNVGPSTQTVQSCFHRAHQAVMCDVSDVHAFVFRNPSSISYTARAHQHHWWPIAATLSSQMFNSPLAFVDSMEAKTTSLARAFISRNDSISNAPSGTCIHQIP